MVEKRLRNNVRQVDRWQGGTLINCLVGSGGDIVFLKFVDVSNKIKNGRTRFELLE